MSTRRIGTDVEQLLDCEGRPGQILADPRHRSPVTEFVVVGVAVSLGVMAAMTGGIRASAAGAPGSVPVGTAGNYSVLASTTATNVGTSTFAQSVGVSTGTAATGFPAGAVVVAGFTQAQADATNAYTNSAARPATFSVLPDISGHAPFTPGVYLATAALTYNGVITLDGGGDANAVFVFQVGTTLTTGSASTVNLVNGASACNVFWQVGTAATLGTSSSFQGTVVAQQAVTATTGDSLVGRLVSLQAAVTLDTDVVSDPCPSSTGPTTVAGPTTTVAGPTTTSATIPTTSSLPAVTIPTGGLSPTTSPFSTPPPARPGLPTTPLERLSIRPSLPVGETFPSSPNAVGTPAAIPVVTGFPTATRPTLRTHVPIVPVVPVVAGIPAVAPSRPASGTALSSFGDSGTLPVLATPAASGVPTLSASLNADTATAPFGTSTIQQGTTSLGLETSGATPLASTGSSSVTTTAAALLPVLAGGVLLVAARRKPGMSTARPPR